MIDPPRGIKGFAGREPLGCALSVGRKDPGKSFPTDTNRFFLVRPVADGKGQQAHRDPHPSYARFNALANPADDPAKVKAHNEARATVRGVIVHQKESECFTFRRQASRLPGHIHPQQAPSCMGDGETAQRWMGQEFRHMPCPGDQCPFSISPDGKRALCGVHAKLIFQLRFEEAACLVCKFTSNGKETTAALLGWFQDIYAQARALGVEAPSLYGIPFMLTISRRSNAEKRTNWPVVHISSDFPPGMTLQSFLLRQTEERAKLVGAHTLALGHAPTTGEDNSEEALAADVERISAGSVP